MAKQFINEQDDHLLHNVFEPANLNVLKHYSIRFNLLLNCNEFYEPAKLATIQYVKEEKKITTFTVRY